MSRAYSVSILFCVLIAGAVPLSLSACAGERKWVPGQLGGGNISFEANFPKALRECVATYDRLHLADLGNGHEYRELTAPIAQCMGRKGWLNVPTTLYTP